MTRRNLNPYTFFEQASLRHQPRHAFTGGDRKSFNAWKRNTLPKVLATLGRRPEPVDLNPELIVEWEEDGLIKQRWVIDVQDGLSAVVLIFRPANLAPGEKRPAILCCHGHGAYGKDSVMGIAASSERSSTVGTFNYNYGLQMARLGFVTYSLDWLGFGERDMRRKPHFQSEHIGQRDPCNVHYLCATMLGTTLLSMNCHDGSRATDFVCQQPYVDADRLGVMGLSLGGTMTTWMALTDERFKAIDVICYAGPFHDIAYRTYNVCGSQVTPSLYDLVDTPELVGLIAPRPLLVELGIHENCFEIDYTYPLHYRRLESICKAAGSPLELDLAPRDHGWCANKSEAFFRHHLQATWA